MNAQEQPLSPTLKVVQLLPQLSEGRKFSVGSAEEKSNKSQNNITNQVKPHYSDLQDILTHKVTKMADFTTLKDLIHEKIPYISYYPLIRLKGFLFKMHRLKLSHYARYLYLNPIEGVLISYKSQQKFPQQPNVIIPLKDIVVLEFMRDSKWYFSRNCYYLKIETTEKESVFFDDNLDVVMFWLRQITQAKQFYEWY